VRVVSQRGDGAVSVRRTDLVHGLKANIRMAARGVN
jgi:hypothetical protein